MNEYKKSLVFFNKFNNLFDIVEQIKNNEACAVNFNRLMVHDAVNRLTITHL